MDRFEFENENKEGVHIGNANEQLRGIRSLILNRGLVYFAVILPPTMVVSVSRGLLNGWHPVYLLHIIAPIIMIVTALLRNRLSFNIRASVILGAFFSLGLAGILTYGLIGNGTLALFAFTVMTAVLFGTRRGIIAGLISTGLTTSIGLMLSTGVLSISLDANQYMNSTIS